MNVSLTPELERLISERVESGLYQTASEVVCEALRLLKERNLAREHLRADVQAGLNQLMRDEGVVYGEPAAVRALSTRIKAEGRKRRDRKG